jgi:hypothetical protein
MGSLVGTRGRNRPHDKKKRLRPATQKLRKVENRRSKSMELSDLRMT